MSSSRFKFSCGFRRRGTPPGSAKVSSLSFFRRRTLNTCHPPAGSPGVEINSFAASQSSPLPHNDPAEPTNTSVEPSAPVHGLPFCGLPQGKIVSISMGRCRRKHLGVEICNCDLGQYIGPIDTESAICYRCDHLLSLHGITSHNAT